MAERLAQLALADFTPCLHQAFRVPFEEGALLLELVEAATVGAGDGNAGRRPPFSLIFEGPKEPRLEQGIHALEHGTLGTLSIFLVPIGPGGKGLHYEALFA